MVDGKSLEPGVVALRVVVDISSVPDLSVSVIELREATLNIRLFLLSFTDG